MMNRLIARLSLILVTAGPGVVPAIGSDVTPSSLADLARFHKPPREVTMVKDGFLWIEAEDFADYGDWRLDTQFVQLMGSAYLLAGGVGLPIRDATTEIKIPKAGHYRIWVRAKNWLKDFAPGKFTLLVGQQPSHHIFGAAATDAWIWESAGEFELPAGPVQLALHDLTGYFARCDALILTTELHYNPPEDLKAYQQERLRLTGASDAVKSVDGYDVVVVGAGTAGWSAAMAAARLGAKTALVQDRPVLGGNASTEMGVPPNGASVSHANARESGLIEEAQLVRAHGEELHMSSAFARLANAEKNLTVFYNQRVMAAETNGDQAITAVRAVDTLTLEPSVYHAKMFIDCTGDGWVGFYAGASYRLGREAADEFKEDLAPPQPDGITMSGCIMGGRALSYRAMNMGHPTEYVPPPWAAKLPPANQFGRKINGFVTGDWWMEHPGDINELSDSERARDELIRITFGFWGYIKNVWADRERARNYALQFVPHMIARRESRRLVGDYILKQQDVQNGVMFPDRISYGGWNLDVHHPQGIYSGLAGPFYCDPRVPLYSIPFRCLYSTNLVNLLFAGRNASVTHIALGSVRVEATLATLGQAAGTAAALCLQRSLTPRELGQRHLIELQQTLLKYDQYIPELKNEDPSDLARAATITASSTQTFAEFTRPQVKGVENHELTTTRATMFPRGLTNRFKTINLLLNSELAEPVDLTLHLRGADTLGDFSATNDLAVATAHIPAGRRSFVSFRVNCAVTQPYAWIWAPKMPGIFWYLAEGGMPVSCRAYGGTDKHKWQVVTAQRYALFTDPPLRFVTDYRPENVIDGTARVVGPTSHLWVSDPQQALPQWVELDFRKPVELNTVHLTFDTDLNRLFPEEPVAPECVRDYRLSYFTGKEWIELLAVKDNFLRHRIHRFPAVKAQKLRLSVEATNGEKSARVFEIRAYREAAER